jgi:hypothetical protein
MANSASPGSDPSAPVTRSRGTARDKCDPLVDALVLDGTGEPAARTRVLNGVVVPGTDFEDERDRYPDHEATVAAAFRQRVDRGDTVVVVGGGWGVTATVAARMTRSGGQVTVYEPSPRMADVLRRTVAANEVGDVVTVERAAVGPVSESSERIFGAADGEMVAPGDLPDCDVLDLDCEGAELDVLSGLDVRPRLLTVEAHPHLGCPRDAVEDRLASMGYDVVRREPIAPDTDITNYVAVRRAE